MPAQVAYRPRVVVKFRDHVELPYEDGVERFLKEREVGPWDQLLKQFPGITLVRLFTSASPNQIRELAARATELDREYKAPNLLTYFAIDCPTDVQPKALAAALQAWHNVETAYVDGGPTPPPGVDPSDDPRFPNQGYLTPAPTGIDAVYAWGFTGGDGAGIRFIDLEQGWTLDHEDLVGAGITLLSGLNQAYHGHGTSVLGEIAAVDNAIGCVGIVPKVSARVVSQHRSAFVYSTADAIVAAVAALGFGDVLLLEAQTEVAAEPRKPYPVEIEQAPFDAIRLGTALGIIIVEAAGNGYHDLDLFADAGGKRILNRSDANFRDSGAIMVGAAASTDPHDRLDFSNHGSRIDCYGWGENIETTGDGWTGTLTNSYAFTYGGFGGTSGASPIVTGAAISLQGIARARLGFRFSPRQMRVLLSDTTNNTASGSPATDRIGVMPDLKKLIDTVLNVAPDVYLRDHVGDLGDPHTGAVASSPDIILQKAAVANPQATYGEGSGTENSDALGAEAVAGQDNFIYVRMRNRGGTATGVSARVYWSPPATLVTPDLWTFVGEVAIPSVPSGNVLTVANGITWPAAAIPASGHYCFVGLVGTALDPRPDPAAFLVWDNFVRFIRENNNVTWRNFNVVNNVPPPGIEPPNVPMAFIAPGAPDLARPMQLEVQAFLPQGAKLSLEMPQYMAESFDLLSPDVPRDAARGTAAVPVNPHGRTTFAETIFPAKSRAKLRLLAHVPPEARNHPYDVIVRQLYQNREVGRITWRLAPRNKMLPPS